MHDQEHWIRWLRNTLTLTGLVLLVALVSMLCSGQPRSKPGGPGCTCPPPCACQDCPGDCGPCLRPPGR